MCRTTNYSIHKWGQDLKWFFVMAPTRILEIKNGKLFVLHGILKTKLKTLFLSMNITGKHM